MQVKRHLVGDSAPLFCVFNSLKNPEFEFLSMFEHAWPVNALFFREEQPGWFLDFTQDICEAIRGVTHSGLFCCGHSSGGSTAIRIGALVGADAVLAFSPQSSLSPSLNPGAAWLPELVALASELDIVGSAGATNCTVVFSTKCSPVDALHRDRFKAAGLARVLEYDSQRPQYCHRIPWEMKERGETRRFFEEVFPCLARH
ncbi:MAG TPA: hypothetical protein VGQ37_22435 [Vicinamibacterales bacterium]|jgi:hypothetical protein|nr:hypothetical protein [Vicinamibacterales bacterium]